jgi:hypothetical protein
MAMTRDELLEVVYRFYPRGLLVGGLGYDDTVERQRQRDAARRGAAEYPTWKAMIRRLRDRYPLMDHSVSLLAGSCDPAYSADIDIPGGGTLYFHVSLLGSYYGIHRTGAPGEEPPALDLAREIEATYPGYAPIPPELGDEVVPDVGHFGKTTIYECLLSNVWKWGSPTWPSPSPPPTDAERVLTALATLVRFGRSKTWVGRSRDDADKLDDDDPDHEAGEPRQ